MSSSKKTSSICRVAVGIIINQSQILIAERPSHTTYPGLWEFPGGKIEVNETQEQALTRELFEEVGIHVVSSHPLITTHYSIDNRTVTLEVSLVLNYQGEPYGKEGQIIRWVATEELTNYQFPPANTIIVAELQKQSIFSSTHL